MSSDSQSVDKIAVKVYDVQSGTTSSDKVAECKVEVTRECHGKNSDFSRESEKLDEEDDDETCHHSVDTVNLKKVVSTKTNTKVDRNVRSDKLRPQTGRRRESRFDDEKRRNVSSRNGGGGGSGKKVFLLPISTGGRSGCSSRNSRHHLCHIKSSQRNKYSHSHSFHGGNRVILITTPLSCCCCCQRKKR